MTEPSEETQILPWHSMKKEQVLEYFKTDISGLSEKEATRRLTLYGPNMLQEGQRISLLRLLLEQFKNYLIILLLFAILLSAIVGELLDTIVIAIIVFFAVILGFTQEFRAERAIEALREMSTPTATVIRSGKHQEITSEQLVPGDIIPFAMGDKIPADARLLESANLQTDEAALTGESVSVEKSADNAALPDSPLGDRQTMVYTGTVATYGRGLAVVVNTGMKTEFGKIAGLLEEVEAGETPLQRNLDRMGKSLAKISIVVIFMVFVAGVLRGHEPFEMFIWAIALAVAVVPEALPAVVTISLAIGVQRMAQRNALIRKLPAVETLGATSVICSDKTGTLTKAEMIVRQVYVGGREVDLASVNLAKLPLGTKEVEYLLLGAGFCNDAQIDENAGELRFIGNPTEVALKALATQQGFTEKCFANYPRIDEIPFTSERKMMTTLHRTPEEILAFCKGAPEIILARTQSVLENGTLSPLSPEKVRDLKDIADKMAQQALRTVAVAFKVVEPNYVKEKLEENLVFLGFIGMIDPPRENVAAAVDECRAAGTKPVMITGDHMITALAIAKELGIAVEGHAITGADLDRMSDEQLAESIDDVEVFARVSPAHKLRVVEAYSHRGHIVAMTGDGINDAPALRRADIGIAMGIKGTDVTKEAADMILADDNFVSIVGAVEEGRIMFSNIKKYLMYLLSANLGEILLLGIAVLLGFPLPLVAIQILYVNLATDGLPALALAVDPPEEDFMQQPPRNAHESIFTRPVVKLMILGGIWSAIVNLTIFLTVLEFGGMSVENGQCMVFVNLILIQFLKAFSYRSDRQSLMDYGPFTNKWLNRAIIWEVFLLLLILYIPFLQRPFRTFSLTPLNWLIVLVSAFSIIPVLEFGKWFFVRRSEIRRSSWRFLWPFGGGCPRM
ncbi:MAG: cation-translocating P-type ATPase [Candidatus Hodarchaeota archaeon]